MNAASYNATFPNWPPLHVTNRWVYGVWIIGNDYRNKAGYYGEYPPTYLKRVRALFPNAKKVLHVFAGTTPKGMWDNETTVDLRQELNPDVVCDVCNMPFENKSFDLVLADPPYSNEDAEHYGRPLVNRRNALKECYRVLETSGHVVWLDQVFPMFRKDELDLVGTIGLIRSTNHRVRTVFIFQKYL